MVPAPDEHWPRKYRLNWLPMFSGFMIPETEAAVQDVLAV